VLTPTALVHLARQHRMNVIAITDHDTTAGIKEAKQAANGSPVVVSGIELSAKADGEDVHMLGYAINVDDAQLQNQLVMMHDARWQRARAIVDRLAVLGLSLDWLQVAAHVKGTIIARPHIARAMIDQGYVGSMAEAFDLYLGNGRPAYVPTDPLTPEAAITMIHAAGGVAVLAHPGLLRNYQAMVAQLAPAGLDGVEVAHPRNAQTMRLMLRSLAKQYDLLMTGGSDFHAVREGRGMIGSETPPHGCMAALHERAQRYSRTNPG
jgi:predicted metal-dependent phosphoesterase TrpH